MPASTFDLIKIAQGTLYDPANGVDGEVGDLWIAEGRIVAAPRNSRLELFRGCAPFHYCTPIFRSPMRSLRDRVLGFHGSTAESAFETRSDRGRARPASKVREPGRLGQS